jgi:hypothetical protein
MIEFLFAVLIATIFAGLLTALARRPESVPASEQTAAVAAGSIFVFLFVVFLLVTWAGGLWVTPFGPTLWGVAWLPLVIVALLAALLLIAAAPERYRFPTRPAGREAAGVAAVVGFGIFFWILAILLLAVIGVGYWL